MSAPNPMENTYSGAPPAVSKKVYPIAGIRTTVYGLDELSPEIKNVACLWLLHPRLQTQACMEPIAASTIGSWNQRLRQMQNPGHSIGLIAVSFDQRNHGSREIDALANEAWRSGNKRHAQDMFSIYREVFSQPIYARQLTDSLRWNLARHLSTNNLPPLLHFPHLISHPHHQPRPRYLPRRTRSMALHPPRPAHHNRHGNHRLPRLHPPNVRPCSTIQTTNLHKQLSSRLTFHRLDRLSPNSRQRCRAIRPGRPLMERSRRQQDQRVR